MNSIISSMKSDFDKTLDYFKSELSKLQTGRAQTALFEGIMIESYGAMQPVKNVAQLTVQDAKTIVIKPWDKSSLSAISTGILNEGLGLNPVNNGETLIINLPDLTEERRRDLTKLIGKMSEEAKISVRQARQSALKSIKRMKDDDEINEDEQKKLESQVQEAIDKVNSDIEKISKEKEAEIMTI
jgi:ribosome recycling factor